MSSHDCRISGVLSLKDGVGEKEVRAALSKLLAYFGTTFEDEVGEDGIALEENCLTLEIDFQGIGNGYRNDALEDGIDALSAVVKGGDWVDLHDFDTGDSDMAVVSRFMGTPEEQQLGRLRYGIDLAEEWIKPLIGDEEFKAVVADIEEKFRGAQAASLTAQRSKPRSSGLGL